MKTNLFRTSIVALIAASAAYAQSSSLSKRMCPSISSPATRL
jgi:hypothetical protein